MEEKRNKDSKCMRLPTKFGGNGTEAYYLLAYHVNCVSKQEGKYS
jgi:hypothetical protein